MTQKTEVVGIRVPAALAAEIKRQAREDDRTVSNFLRRLLNRYLQDRAQTSASDK